MTSSQEYKELRTTMLITPANMKTSYWISLHTYGHLVIQTE